MITRANFILSMVAVLAILVAVVSKIQESEQWKLLRRVKSLAISENKRANDQFASALFWKNEAEKWQQLEEFDQHTLSLAMTLAESNQESWQESMDEADIAQKTLDQANRALEDFAGHSSAPFAEMLTPDMIGTITYGTAPNIPPTATQTK